jgi:ABC-2 type transport system ATP-binding protein
MPTPVVTVRALSKRYGRTIAIADVSLDVFEGEIFGLIGPNGAGKTTTMECIQGSRHADGGAITVLGLDPRRDSTALRRRIGVQHQEAQLQKRIKVWEAVDLWASLYDRDHVADRDALLEQLGLAAKRDAWFKNLSGGQKQRLFIALALIGNPEVAFLDELTTGLDPQARRDTWELIEGIRSKGVTVLLVTHFMEEAERLCDRLAIIDQGRVVAVDSPAGLIARVDASQRMRFRPSVPLEDRLLADLPEVSSVTRQGDHLVVSGNAHVVQAVTGVLARNRILAEELRVDQSSLDDAFVALTGRKMTEPGRE